MIPERKLEPDEPRDRDPERELEISREWEEIQSELNYSKDADQEPGCL